MKKILLILIINLVMFPVFSQTVFYNAHKVKYQGYDILYTLPPVGVSASDNFNSYADDDTLTINENWVMERGATDVLVIDNPTGTAGTLHSPTVAWGVAYWDDDFSADQYSQFTYNEEGASYYSGVVVRCSGTDPATDYEYYSWIGRTTQTRFQRSSGGTVISLLVETDAEDIWDEGDVLRLEVIGDTLYFYRNGELETNFANSGKFVDPLPAVKIDDGKPGIITNNYSNAIDDWSGGDL